jgi:uncharacterized protein (DUF4415 family)
MKTKMERNSTSASSRREPRNVGNEKNIVRSTRKTGDPLSAASMRRLAKLSQQTDSDIDFSDIPRNSRGSWLAGNRGAHPALGQQVQIPLDTDVVEFFREKGESLTVAINAALRKIIQSEVFVGASKEMQKKAS